MVTSGMVGCFDNLTRAQQHRKTPKEKRKKERKKKVNYENEEYGIVMEVTRQMTIATRQEEPRMDGPIQNITQNEPHTTTTTN